MAGMLSQRESPYSDNIDAVAASIANYSGLAMRSTEA